MIDLWNEYINWLLNRVHFENLRGDVRHGFSSSLKYKKLMDILGNTTFNVIIERDVNRVKDGLSLRYDFFDDCGVNGGCFTQPCSILEFLIGLSIRIDTEYIGDPAEECPEFIFWEMICNLGLDKMDDTNFNTEDVREILDIFVNREYRGDGKGNIFPLKSVTIDEKGDKIDQKNVEIWSQMLAYISENY